VKGLLARFREWVGSGEAEPGREPSRADEDGSSLSKADITRDLGMTPEQYLYDQIEAAGGRIRQQDLCSCTDWSESTVSRTLSDMESEGDIERIRIGREKVVYFPEVGAGPRSQPTNDPDQSATGEESVS
jgi:hypothetical protein